MPLCLGQIRVRGGVCLWRWYKCPLRNGTGKRIAGWLCGLKGRLEFGVVGVGVDHGCSDLICKWLMSCMEVIMSNLAPELLQRC